MRFTYLAHRRAVADATAESRPHNSIAVHRGSLHYAYDIARNATVLTRNAQQPLAADLQFDATAPWQYAIDPASLRFHNAPPAGGTLPSPVFDSGLPPLSITATACAIEWAVAGDTFAASPPSNPACTGPATNITLRPFGVSTASMTWRRVLTDSACQSTKLRIGEFPTAKIAA